MNWRRWTVVTASVAIVALVVWAARRDHKAEGVWDPKAPQWAGPVTVHVSPALAEHDEPIQAAIDSINGRVGCRVLKRTDEPFAEVRLRPDDGVACGDSVDGVDKPASAYYCAGYVDVVFRRLDSIGLAHRMALHELGHTLGLGHDEVGMMAPSVVEPQAGDYPEYLLLSNKDAAALRERLCR